MPCCGGVFAFHHVSVAHCLIITYYYFYTALLLLVASHFLL